MILFVQVILNLILGYWLSNRLFIPYSRIAFLLYPLFTIVVVVSSPMVMLAMSDIPDPSAISINTHIMAVAVILAFLSIAVQAVFHFFVFKALRRRFSN